MILPPLLDWLNKEWYIDDDIRCEDNTDVVREYNQIIVKYQLQSTKASKVYQLLIKRNYIQDNFEESFGFIRWYFYFIWQPEANEK